MTLLDVFWIFLIIVLLQPVVRRRMVETARTRMMRKIEESGADGPPIRSTSQASRGPPHSATSRSRHRTFMATASRLPGSSATCFFRSGATRVI